MSSSIGQSFNQDSSGNISRPSSYTTGTIVAVNGVVQITVPEGDASWDIYLSGTYSAGTIIAFEGSLDGTNWFFLNGRRNTDINTNDQTSSFDTSPAGGAAPTGANPSNWRGALAGVRFFRARANTFTTSDAVAVQISTSVGVGAVFQNAAPPAPADKMSSGTITALNGSVIASTNGSSSVIFSLSGTWVATLALQGTVDGTNWFAIAGQIPLSIVTNLFTANGLVIVPAGGMSQIRLTASSFTSGTATVTWDASTGTNTVQTISFTASAMQTTSRLNDGSGNTLSSNNSQLQTRDVINTSSQYRAQSVTTTAAEALGAATILVNRKFISITPTNGTVYWATNSSVTTTNGSPLFPNNTLFLSFTDNVHVYLIAAATTDVRILEGS